MKSLKINIILILAASSLWLGCSDLEENPDFSSPLTFYQTENDAILTINGIYDDLGTGWFNHMYNRYVWDCVFGYSRGYEKQPLDFNTGAYSPSDGVNKSFWERNYRIINSANTALAKIPDIDMDAGLKARLLGEAKFLRGFSYYILASYYQEIPVYTEPTTDILNGAKGNTPADGGGFENAMNQAISDLESAAGALPASYDGNDLGRANKWAALGFLAKANLQAGNWDAARTAAEEVINTSGLSLFDDYADNFQLATQGQGERVFELQSVWTSSVNERSNIHYHFAPTDWTGPNCTSKPAGWADAWLYGAPEFRSTYDPADKRIVGTFVEGYCSRNRNSDMPDATIDDMWVTWDPDAPSFFVGPGLPQDTYQSAYVTKYLDPELDNAGRYDVNFPFLRYADVLMTHSEAANESGSGDPYLGINLVRERAGLPLLAGLSQVDLREAILQESIKEFAFEGQTFITMKRAGEAKWKEFAELYLTRPFQLKDMVLPIPTSEVNANPGIDQHDVWK